MGSIHKIDSISALAATTTKTLDDEPSGAFSTASFLIDITAITGTWTITCSLNIGGVLVTVAEVQYAAASGAAIVPITLAAAFALDEAAVPAINSITYTEDVAGALTGVVYAAYA